MWSPTLQRCNPKDIFLTIFSKLNLCPRRNFCHQYLALSIPIILSRLTGICVIYYPPLPDFYRRHIWAHLGTYFLPVHITTKFGLSFNLVEVICNVRCRIFHRKLFTLLWTFCVYLSTAHLNGLKSLIEQSLYIKQEKRFPHSPIRLLCMHHCHT